jgi:hypothetical protein
MMIQIERTVHKFKQQKIVKIPGLALQIDASTWLIFVSFILAIMVGIYALVTNGKTTATKMELDQIKSAVLQYEATASGSTAPADLDVLLSSYTDADGNTDTALLTAKGRWATSVVDRWGTKYSIDTSARVLSSTGSGSTISLTY